MTLRSKAFSFHEPRSIHIALIAVSFAALAAACGRPLSLEEPAGGRAFAEGGSNDAGLGGTSNASGRNGAGGAGGQVTSEGGAAGAAAPSAPDYCGELQLEFDGRRCVEDDDCIANICDCGDFGYSSLSSCDPTRGCLVNMNCEALCARQIFTKGGIHAAACVEQACKTDDDCRTDSSSGVCVRREDADWGFCSAGDSYCVDQTDCSDGAQCTLSKENGTRACLSAEEHCTTSADCAVGECAMPSDAYVGRCTDGNDNDRCFEQEDCLAPLRCVRTVPELEPGRCSTGEGDAWCTTDDDCLEGHCFPGPFDQHARCSTGKLWQLCGQDSDCESKSCILSFCADGSEDSPCETPSDCQNDAMCVRNLCKEGKSGNECLNAEDCRSGFCAVDFAMEEGDQGRQSVCVDGLPGSVCDGDSDCISDFCEAWRCQ